MSDLWQEVDRVIDGLERLSSLAQLRDKVRYANEASRATCGDCHFWMKSQQCPREKNVNGYSRGPSMDGLPCSKFERTAFSFEIISKRRTEAEDFAIEHSLPGPVWAEVKAND